MGVEAADLIGYDLKKPRLALLDATRRGDRDAAATLVRQLGLL
jgi:hypothetical protein